MRAEDDPGAKRNRGGSSGLWLINALTASLVVVCSLYLFRAEQTRADARQALAAVEAMPGQIAAPPAMAAPAPQ